MDLLGDIGGIYELIIGFMGVYMYLISHYSFNLLAIKKMYLVKTKENLFQNKKGEMTNRISVAPL